METDASIEGLDAILSQKKSDGKLHPVAYASRSTSSAERHCSITELETLAVVWAVQHFRAYLYGHNVTVITDHSAVKVVLDKPDSNGKYARWWLKIFSSGIGNVRIVYRPGRENVEADTLSRCPATTETTEATYLDEFVLRVSSQETSISDLFDTPVPTNVIQNDLHLEQRKDPKLKTIITYLEEGVLPQDEKEARRIVTLATNLAILDNVLIREQGGDVRLFPVTYEVKYRNSTMVGRCRDTSLAVDSMPLCATAGGGRTCILMQ